MYIIFESKIVNSTDYTLRNNSGYGGIIATLIIFLINPTLGLIFSLMFAIGSGDDYNYNHRNLLAFIIFTAAWISLINITKSINGDQGVYTRIFLKVPEAGFHGTIFNAWGGSGKEPLFSCITWSLYWLTNGSVRLYYFILSFTIYILHYLATYKLFKKIDASKGALICGVLVLTFFTQYFVMTLHIIRQMLAAAVAIYAIAYRATEGKYNWWLLIAAPLIHTSAFFLVILSLIPWLYSWMNIKKIAIVLAFFIPVIIFSTTIGSMLGESDISAISYAGQRLGEEGATDGGGIKLSIMLTVFIPLGLSTLCVIWRNRVKKQAVEDDTEGYVVYDLEDDIDEHYSGIKDGNAILPIAYLAILTMIFVLSFSKTPIIQYRFFYYSYSFIPLLLPLLFKDRTKLAKIYQFGISLFFVVRFFLTHNDSGFTYAPVLNLLAQPITYYFTGNFSPLYN